MTRKSGFKTWPPVWTTILNENDKPTGEVGTLNQALMNDRLNNKIFLRIQYQNMPYVGLLQFDDLKFCYEVFTLLKAHIGYSIKEIGDLDLSYTPQLD